jgi:small nuclear ribonucleoprotein B and B'
MMSLLNYRLKITLQDGRNLIGQMLAFDKHMNLVLGDTEEFRKIKNKGKVATGIAGREEKRSLGLVILRGETIVALSVEAPPPSGEKRNAASFIPGTGAGRPAGYVLLCNIRRGLPMAPPSATQLPVGLGAPSAAMMQPQVSAAPVSYNGRPPMGMIFYFTL